MKDVKITKLISKLIKSYIRYGDVNVVMTMDDVPADAKGIVSDTSLVLEYLMDALIKESNMANISQKQ